MKPITLHPISVLVGAALVGLSFVLSGAAQTPTVTHHPRTEVVGVIPAAWWTYVRLNFPSQATYTVPLDRHFVVTATPASGNSALFVNGVAAPGDLLQPTQLSQLDHDTRVVFEPGSILEVQSSQMQLWGYLEPVR